MCLAFNGVSDSENAGEGTSEPSRRAFGGAATLEPSRLSTHACEGAMKSLTSPILTTPEKLAMPPEAWCLAEALPSSKSKDWLGSGQVDVYREAITV